MFGPSGVKLENLKDKKREVACSEYCMEWQDITLEWSSYPVTYLLVTMDKSFLSFGIIRALIIILILNCWGGCND